MCEAQVWSVKVAAKTLNLGNEDMLPVPSWYSPGIKRMHLLTLLVSRTPTILVNARWTKGPFYVRGILRHSIHLEGYNVVCFDNFILFVQEVGRQNSQVAFL